MFFLKSEKSTDSAAAIRTSTGVALRYHRSDFGTDLYSGHCKPAGNRAA